MSFLAPAFLAGLALLAIPVLIHLIQRERKRVVVFPSLMFVRKVPYKSVRRRRIRHWALLLLRAAAIFLIVAAFARPFMRRSPLAIRATAGAREVVVLLDRSYSMAYGDRWERARAAARRAVEALDSGDRVSLILFARGAQAEVRSSPEHGRVLAAIDAARVGSGATRYGPALKLAQSILAQSSQPRREAILITDFQKVAWEPADAIRLPEGTTVTPVAIDDSATSNVTVTSVAIQRASFANQERITVTAGVRNRGATAFPDLPVTLEIDGRELHSQRVSLAADGSQSLTFPPFTLIDPYTHGTVRAGTDALSADNAFHFVVSPAQPVSVLMLERGDAPRESSLYLTRAMAIGTAPSFKLDVVSTARVTPADLADRSVVILNGVSPPRGATGERLRRFVESGGGVLVVVGDGTLTSGELRDFAPGAVRAAIERSPDGAALTGLDYSHAIFEPFKAPRSGDFSTARVYRYRGLTLTDDARVLARFDDGGVALAERKVGEGRTMVWTSTLDTTSGDLPLKPIFLPFVHQVLRYLAGYVEPPAWFTVEQVLDRREAGDVALTPSGDQIPLDDEQSQGIVELAEQGFYEIRSAIGRQRRPVAIASNLDVTESDLTTFDPREVVAALAGRGSAAVRTGVPEAETTPEDQERQQAVWWYLLVAGVVLLAVETAISNALTMPGSMK